MVPRPVHSLIRYGASNPILVQRGVIAVLLAGATLGMVGGTWDAAWHVTRQRETFWSPPHLLLYSATILGFLASTFAIMVAWLLPADATFPGPLIRLRRWLPLGFVVTACGAFVVVGSAPLDEFWHRTFGRDVDVWSFPHVVALIGAVGISVGSVFAVGSDWHSSPGRTTWHRIVTISFLAVTAWAAMFSLNWYTLVLARLRDSVQYPILASLVTAPLLVLAAMAVGRGGATLVALQYTLVTFALHWVLSLAGFALLPIPPLIVVPALVVDLVLWSQPVPSWRRALLAALCVPAVLYAAEAASLAWLPHPPVGYPSDALALSYLEAMLDRPWDWSHILFALPIATAIAALSGLGGW